MIPPPAMTDEADLERIEELLAKATPLPWTWTVQDVSEAVLSGADCLVDHVMVAAPCSACVTRAQDAGEEWKWGRCTAPTEANAALIATAVNALPHLLARLRAAEAERDEARTLAERLKLEAQIHAVEARSQRATVHEAYRAVTGGTGEPGDWHGAQPIRELATRATAAEARVAELEEGLQPFAEADIDVSHTAAVGVTPKDILRARALLASRL